MDHGPNTIEGRLELTQRVADGFRYRIRERRMSAVAWVLLLVFFLPLVFAVASALAWVLGLR